MSNLLGRPIPIGVFWDMENCIVPFKYSALEFVTNLRNRFYDGHFEADFIGVCDIQIQRKSVLMELTYAQVTTVHVCNTCKNAADDKLRLLIRKFANLYPSPATIILITSDINFSPELSDLRYKYNYRTILIHGRNISSSLLSIPNEAFYFDGFFTAIDVLSDLTIVDNENILFVRNLPFLSSESRLKDLLDKLFSTTKGRVLSFAENIAIIKFPNFEAALRAKARYSNQRIMGKRINISIPNGVLLHRMMPDNMKSPQRPAIASAAKIACDLASGSNEQISLIDNDTRNTCSDIELSEIPKINPDGKGWKSSSRRYLGDSMPSHNNNNVVVTQVFRYPEAVSDSNFNDQSKEFFQNAFTERSGQQIMYNGVDNKHEFSLHKESNCNQKNGRQVFVNRKLFSENEKQTWSGSNQPHKFATPKGYYEAGFRRTPGAHRSANHNNHHQDLRPQFLFTSNMLPSRAENGNRKSLRNFGTFSEKRPNQSLKNWQNVDNTSGVDLVVSNLDYNISTHEWKKILSAEFHNAQMRSLSVQMQPNNTSVALINVSTMEDAKYVMSHFHKKKIGYKRIQVSIVNPGDSLEQLETTRSLVTSLLISTPGQKLPLIQFFEIFEKRHQKRLTILDLQDMSDHVKVIEQEGLGKLVMLCSDEVDEKDDDILPCQHFCIEHVEASLWDGVNFDKNPKVKISLEVLTAHVHMLLQKHGEGFPLSSFPACYAREFSSLKLVLDEDGVSLEHLITCIPGVEIIAQPLGVKHLRWSENPRTEASSLCKVPVLSDNLKQLNQEISELLINTPKCCMEVSKFQILYQQYFGRQCRCSDFGCDSPNELLNNLSHSIQMVGSGSTSCITFTHPIQVSRFSSDLDKILKVQGHKQLDILNLPPIYSNVIGKSFDITEFGVCFVEDMISELEESAIVVTKIKNNTFLSKTTKDQTAKAKDETIKYNEDIVALIRQSPNCSLPYDQFTTAYYHQFGTHFRFAECGFVQISDFFDAISDSIKIKQLLKEKHLQLSEREMTKLLKEQFLKMFEITQKNSMEISEFSDLYINTFGQSWKFKDYDVSNVEELFEKMAPEILLKGSCVHKVVVCKERIEEVSSNVMLVVMDFSDGCMFFEDLHEIYWTCFHDDITESFIKEYMKDLLIVQKSPIKDDSFHVKLLPAQMFAKDVRWLLLNQQHQTLFLTQFEETYQNFFKMPLRPELYNHESLASLFKVVSKVISYDGCLSNWKICLQPKFKNCLNSSSKDLLRLPDNQLPIIKDSQRSNRNLAFEGLVPKENLKSDSNLFKLNKKEKMGMRTSFSHTPMSELMAFAAKLLPTEVYKDSHLEKRIENGISELHLRKDNQSMARSKTVDFSVLTDFDKLNQQYVEMMDSLNLKSSSNKTKDFKMVEYFQSTELSKHCKVSKGVTMLENKQNNLEDSFPSAQLDLQPIDENRPETSSNSTPSSDMSHSTIRPLKSTLKKSRIVAKINLTS